MRSIRWTSDFSSGGTEDVDFIRCVDGQDPQIYEMQCLGSDNVTPKNNPTTKVEVGTVTVGQFTTNYLAENGCIIPIIRELSIYRSVQLLGIPDFVRNSGL